MVHRLVAEGARVLATGLAGAIAYDGVRRLARAGLFRAVAVTTTAWGLRGARAVGTGAEATRLKAGDILSEARGRVGEQAPVPGAAHGNGHEH